MKIGIIGVGNIGGTLARKFGAAGHELLLANSRDADSIRVLADEIGATAVSAGQAARGVDVVVLSIPQGHVPDLATDLFADLAPGAVVIDTNNYFPHLRDQPIPALDAGQTDSEWVVDRIGRPVIKAFNSILADSLAQNGRPAGDPDRIALAVAGDDGSAKAIVIGLLDDAGFDGVDAGSLAESWRQQPKTGAYCTDLRADELRRALSQADRVDALRNRDAAIERRLAASRP